MLMITNTLGLKDKYKTKVKGKPKLSEKEGTKILV